MGIDKDFVIRNGIEVNEDLLYADAVNDRVGIGTSVPECSLDVVGNICGSASVSAATTVFTENLAVTGFATISQSLDVGIAGTVFSVSVIDQTVGVGTSAPTYTHEIIGPVSIGQTAGYIYGDLFVTGNITGTNLNGQITAGGTVTFSDVTVTNVIDANDVKIYSRFDVQRIGQQFNFITDGDPPGIGFTQNTQNPELYLLRGKRYQFHADTPGFPFYIKSEPTANVNDLFGDGVFNNGAQVGIVTFEVPYNAPNILYYQASNVAGMGGTIYLNNDYKSINVGIATVSEFLDAFNGDFTYINVTGFGTIANFADVGGATISSGIVTANKFVGVATGADGISIHQKNNDVAYQVTFTDKITSFSGLGSNYQLVYTDTDDNDLTYNPSNKTLTAQNFAGIATGAERIKVRKEASNNNFQVHFSDNSETGYELVRIDGDSSELTYNPSTNTLNVSNVSVTKFIGDIYASNTTSKILENGTDGTDATFTGQASNSTNVDILNDGSTNAAHFVNYTNTVSGNQRIQADSDFKYNPSTGHLTVPEVFAFLAGTAEQTLNIEVGDRNNNQNYQVGFTTASTGQSLFQRYYVDRDGSHFTYNPATGRLTAPIFTGNGNELTNINVENIIGNNAGDVINIDLIPNATTISEGVVQLSNAINGTSQTVAASEKAVGDLKIHANNATNLSNGTVNNNRLLKASLVQQGIVSLSDSIDGTSQTVAASERAVSLLNAHAGNASNLTEGLVNINLIQNATTSQEGVVQLSNAINGTRQTIAASEYAVGQLKNYVDTTPINIDLLPKASYTQQGIVQLSQKFDSESSSAASLAFTEQGAVKLRAHANNASNLSSGTVNNARLNSATTSSSGIVQLNNAINSTSTTLAASSKAVNDLRLATTNASNITSGTLNSDRINRATYSTVGVTLLSKTFTGAVDSDSDDLSFTEEGAINLRAHANNASNLSSGTVNNARLNKASTSTQGIVKLDNTFPPTSTSTSETATTNVVRQVYNAAVESNFPTGTRLVFAQQNAPTGWTRQDGFTNRALRVAGNTDYGNGIGGSVIFDNAFTQRNVPLPSHGHISITGDNIGDHKHHGDTDQRGQHNHNFRDDGHIHGFNRAFEEEGESASGSGSGNRDGNAAEGQTHRSEAGINFDAHGGHTHQLDTGNQQGSHFHQVGVQVTGVDNANIDFRLAYVNVIICRKD